MQYADFFSLYKLLRFLFNACKRKTKFAFFDVYFLFAPESNASPANYFIA